MQAPIATLNLGHGDFGRRRGSPKYIRQSLQGRQLPKWIEWFCSLRSPRSVGVVSMHHRHSNMLRRMPVLLRRVTMLCVPLIICLGYAFDHSKICMRTAVEVEVRPQ